MDVTLGSLWGESLGVLEEMGWLGSSESSSGSSSEGEEEEMDEGVEGRGEKRLASLRAPDAMRNRGMPFFEELVEDSRLGRIKRQRGGHTSADGRSRVEWEVTEIEGGDGDDAVMQEVEVGNSNKRVKLGD